MLSRRGWPNGADFCRWVDTGFIVLGCGGTRIFVLALVIAAASCHLETHHCKFLFMDCLTEPQELEYCHGGHCRELNCIGTATQPDLR